MTTYTIFPEHIVKRVDNTDFVYVSHEDFFFILQMLANDFYEVSFLHGYGQEYRSISQFIDLLRFSTLGIAAKCEILRTLVLFFNIPSNPLFVIKLSTTFYS